MIGQWTTQSPSQPHHTHLFQGRLTVPWLSNPRVNVTSLIGLPLSPSSPKCHTESSAGLLEGVDHAVIRWGLVLGGQEAFEAVAPQPEGVPLVGHQGG